jgi:hypothetical protein
VGKNKPLWYAYRESVKPVNIVDTNGNPIRADSDQVEPVPIESQDERIKPRQVGTGAQRGQQTLVNTDGSKMVYGILPDNAGFGIAFYNSDGDLVSKQTGTNRYLYDEDGNNYLQDGILADGTRGFIIVKPGFTVDDVIND